jgi:hypothetical protein
VKGGYVMDRKQAILVAKDILATIVRNVHLRRELVKVCAEPKLNFWRVMYGNLTDTAALEWCKLFGSDDSETQPVHWKSLACAPNWQNSVTVCCQKIWSNTACSLRRSAARSRVSH